MQSAERKKLHDKFKRRLRLCVPRGRLFDNTMESDDVNAVLKIMESYNVGANIFGIKLRIPKG